VSTPDDLPELVRRFLAAPDGPEAHRLLDEVARHVRRVSRSYPAAWFALGEKTPESVEDLGNRVFTVCAAVKKGRFPFQGRVPFTAFAEERMEGRAIRYHSFYAKISITREIMRDDYARNIVRDPVLRWRADLYREVGDGLAALAESGAANKERRGRGVPPTWSLTGGGPRMVRSAEEVAVSLKRRLPTDVPTLVALALREGGPATQSTLTRLIEDTLGTPDKPEPRVDKGDADLQTRLAVREAVAGAWSELAEQDRSLLVAVARGESYDDLVARDPRFKHKVAVTRAVKRCGTGFVRRVLGDLGMEGAASAPPQQLVEAIMGVLEEILPTSPATEESA
jgi:hypothetical protein